MWESVSCFARCCRSAANQPQHTGGIEWLLQSKASSLPRACWAGPMQCRTALESSLFLPGPHSSTSPPPLWKETKAAPFKTESILWLEWSVNQAPWLKRSEEPVHTETRSSSSGTKLMMRCDSSPDGFLLKILHRCLLVSSLPHHLVNPSGTRVVLQMFV